MASGQVDMAGAWYIHTIDFQSKGKDVIDLVQLSGAPGRARDVRHQQRRALGGRLQGQDAGRHRPRLGHRRADPVPRRPEGHHAAAITTPSPSAPGRRRSPRSSAAPPQCVMTTQPTVGALESEEARLLGDRPRHHQRRDAGARRRLAGGRRARPGRLGEQPTRTPAQKVVDALVATMHWINTHSATDIANKLPPDVRAEQHDHQGAVHRRPDDRQGPVPARRHHAGRRPEDRLRHGEADRRRTSRRSSCRTPSPTSTR